MCIIKPIIPGNIFSQRYIILDSETILEYLKSKTCDTLCHLGDHQFSSLGGNPKLFAGMPLIQFWQRYATQGTGAGIWFAS